MRKKYRKPLCLINKSIQELNKEIAIDPKWHGRFFVKNIAFATLPAERIDPKNNSFCLVMRFYDKETCNYVERIAHINPSSLYYVKNFAYHTYEQLNSFVHFNVEEVIEGKDYNKIPNNYTIRHGKNIQSGIKFTKRKN